MSIDVNNNKVESYVDSKCCICDKCPCLSECRCCFMPWIKAKNIVYYTDNGSCLCETCISEYHRTKSIMELILDEMKDNLQKDNLHIHI